MKDKIKPLTELVGIVKKLKDQGKRIVFTNGCFDLLHVGHIRSLASARKFGDVLVVGVNSDSSVRALKGEERPIVPEEERVEVLSYLEIVDYLVIFSETTSSRVLERLKPDVYVKGGDYSLSTLPEWPVVKEYGGEVELVSEIKGCSTSEIIDRIKGL